MKFIRNFLPFLFLVAFFSCEPDTIEKIEFSTKAGRDVLVICEGQFNNMNAGITYINLDADTLVLDIYSKINSQPLGDVLQSAYLWKDEILLVTNNPGTIKVLDKSKLTLKRTIEINGNPKHIALSSNDEMYVSDVFSGFHIVNMITGINTQIADLSGASGEIIEIDGKVFVTSPGSYGSPDNKLRIYNKSDNSLFKELAISSGPTSIAKFGESILVMCSGDAANGPAIEEISLSDNTLTKTYDLEGKIEPAFSYEVKNISGKTYILSNKIYDFNTSTETATVINDIAQSLYGFDFNSTNADLFICDAVDFSSKGKFTIANSSWEVKKTYEVGFVPNGALLIE